MAEKVILAIDVGSSSIRCSAYRYTANENNDVTIDPLPSTTSTIKKRCVEPISGKINIVSPPIDDNHTTTTTLMDDIDSCITSTLQILRHRFPSFTVVGLGMTTFAMNLIGVNSHGQPLGPHATFTYACNDDDVISECHVLRKELKEEEEDLIRRTGTMTIHSSYALPQLRRFYATEEKEEEEEDVVSSWYTIAGLCLSRWSPSSITSIMSHSEASWTGLYNIYDNAWDDRCLSLLSSSTTVPLRFPTITSGTTPLFRGTNATYATLWPEMTHCHFFPGMSDGACANVGSKCCWESRMAVTIGTSAALRVVVDWGRVKERGSVPRGLWCYRIDEEKVLVGGALTDGGSIIEWARSFLNMTDETFNESMTRLASSSNDDNNNNNLTIIPFLGGERSTGYRNGARGVISGFTRLTTPHDFIRGCLESVVLRLGAIDRLVRQVLVDDDDVVIVASGNALEMNGVWRQMIADCTGRSVVLDDEVTEGTSRGMARVVGMGVAKKEMGEGGGGGLWEKEESLVIREMLEPREGARGRWEVGAAIQEELIETVSPLWV